MSKKTMRKVTSSVLALACVTACAGTMTACETSRPEFRMEITFNGESYSLDYTLYRKVNPATTKHFIWLVESGYYDGLCIHDYEDGSRMYTGAFTAAQDDNDADGLVARNYFDFVTKHKDVASFPHSVWKDREQTTSLYTLRGEFSDNDFIVENGKLQQTFGSLSMYYQSNADGEEAYVEYAGKDGMAVREYKYNCATSTFFFSLASSTSAASTEFCTFADLKSGSKDDLEDLLDAIDAYVEENYGEDSEGDFTESKRVIIGQGDLLLTDNEKSVLYDVPQEPIVIESIKMTKY